MTQTEENKIILLCRQLLDILEREKEEITSRNFDNMEHFGLIKENLLKDIQDPANIGLWTSSPEETAEIRSLMEKIVDVNTSNEKALLNIKEEMIAEFSTIQTTKTAHKAYNAGQ